MLYVTTRTDRDAFTCHRAMTEDLGYDGGQFLPRIMPEFDEAALEDVAKRSFNENVAHILNLLYRAKLTGRDVELAIGKRPMTIRELSSRITAAELWPEGEHPFSEFVLRLLRLLDRDPASRPGQWFITSVRIAVLFGIYGELMAQGLVSAENPLDISVPSDDFQFPMAAVYARSWGLPIGQIIVCCNENNSPWTLLHQGQLRPDMDLHHTGTPACDQIVPTGLERLVFHRLGIGETRYYLGRIAARRAYKPSPEQLARLREGIAVSVVSGRRVAFMIPNLCRAGEWYPDPYTAMAYAGLVDYRARTGATGRGLVICQENPLFHTDLLAQILGLPADTLRRRLEKH